jgi:hypothetical protein
MPAIPDSFFVASELEAELNKSCSCKIVDNASDIQIVDAAGNVQIPRKYVPLLPGERVIAGHGVVYVMTCMDWIKAIFSFGIYYLWCIRRKKLSRTAVVLTTKRILVLDIHQFGGRIPDSMMKFSVVIRSMLPGAIKAGYIHGYSTLTIMEVVYSLCCSCLMMALHESQRVRASVMCDAGSFTADFKQSNGGLAFAKALQMATSRSETRVNMTASRAQDADTCVTELDKTFIPLISTETVFARHAGYNKYQPCCDLGPLCAALNNLLCSFQYGVQSTVYLCSKRALCCFPFCPMAFTCGLRPFMMKTDYIITDQSIYYVASKTSEPWISCPLNENGFFVGEFSCPPLCTCVDYSIPFSAMISVTIEEFLPPSFLLWSAAWMPANSLYSIELELKSFGKETCFRRMCAQIECCAFFVNVCCPMARATYELVLGGQATERVEGGLHYSLGVMPKKQSTWRDDPQLQHTHTLLATMQTTITADERV